MATFRDLLSAAKSEITEVSTDTAADRIAAGSTVLDVREPDEYDQGAIPGAIHIPRGHLEAQVEGRSADKTDAGRRVLRRRRALGVRRQDAAGARLHRRRVDGRRLRALEGRGPRRGSTPVVAHARADATATSATCCCPRSASRARRSCSTPRCCCSAPVASARRPRCTSPRPASARSASSTWTRSTRPTCSARSCTTSTASATARSTRRRRR